MQPDDHYVIITADSHAGGSHAQYREFLDPAYRDDFDAWRNKYKNPFKDLKDTDLRTRNWDSDLRDQQQHDDGIVGEVIFPNPVPPFFPSFVLFAEPPRPEDYEHRHAGVQAHNRWLADYCAQKPEARAGIGQIFLNDVDDAIADVRWCVDNGLRGNAMATLVMRSRSHTGAAATSGKKRSCEFSKLKTPSTPSAWSSGARRAASMTDCESWTSTCMGMRGSYRGTTSPPAASVRTAPERSTTDEDGSPCSPTTTT